MGDFRYSAKAVKVKKNLLYRDAPYYRYELEGVKNVSFTENQLLPSQFLDI